MAAVSHKQADGSILTSGFGLVSREPGITRLLVPLLALGDTPISNLDPEKFRAFNVTGWKFRWCDPHFATVEGKINPCFILEREYASTSTQVLRWNPADQRLTSEGFKPPLFAKPLLRPGSTIVKLEGKTFTFDYSGVVRLENGASASERLIGEIFPLKNSAGDDLSDYGIIIALSSPNEYYWRALNEIFAESELVEKL